MNYSTRGCMYCEGSCNKECLPKKETLEEAAVFKSHHSEEDFIRGGRWQQEQDKNNYSKDDMKSFADWCRNGLLNIEYSVDKLDEHLEHWESFKKK